jgi:hypothetical protein
MIALGKPSTIIATLPSYNEDTTPSIRPEGLAKF